MTTLYNGRSSLVRRALAALTAALLAACGGGGGMGSPTPTGSSKTAYAGSADPSAVATARAAKTPVAPALVAADNSFGLALLGALDAGNTANNIAISPVSVSMALQILYNGAAGTTQQEMVQALSLGTLGSAELDGDNAALEAALAGADPAVDVTLANSLWLHLDQTPVLTSFVDMDQRYYGAALGDLSGAPDNVNAWVASETHGLIAQILPPDSTYSTTVALLVNAVYFKAPWSAPFDSSLTASAPFTLTDGTTTSVQMMRQNEVTVPYQSGSWNDTGFQALRLPYGAGHVSMLIVMPDAGTSMPTFVSSLTAEELANIDAGLKAPSAFVALPRFKTSYGHSLHPVLDTLGMADAFCPGNADLSGLVAAGTPVCLGDVVHQTLVEVDESGTVAAGATAVTVVTTVAQLAPLITIDRPFFYAIEDDASGTLLFVGVMMNPNAG